jgi:hypothetical protein
MDIKMDFFLQKSGFTNMHIFDKVHLGFSSNFAKIYFNINGLQTPVFSKDEFCFVS